MKLRDVGINREVVVLSLARSADAFCNSLLIVVLPLYIIRMPKQAFFARLPEETLVGILLGLASLIFALMQPVAATVSDRAGRRKPFILWGLGVLALATIGYIPANSYTALVALRALQGLAIAITIPTALALIADYSERESVGGSMGVFGTARMIGFATGPLAGGYLTEMISFEAAFIAGALGALLSLTLVQLYVPEVKVEDETERLRRSASPAEDESTPGISDSMKTETGESGIDKAETRRIFRQLYLVGIALFVTALSMGLITALEFEINRRLNQTAIGYGVAFSMLTLGMLFFQIPIGHWSDKIGRNCRGDDHRSFVCDGR